MVERADELAALLNASVSTEDGRPDAYFEPEGEAYLASLLLAAAVAKEPMSVVWRVGTPRKIAAIPVDLALGHPSAGHAGVRRVRIRRVSADGVRDLA
ncbi:hypothetical protein GCM10027418_22440 [Mariniluteicoccus endophyticus]